MGGGGVAEPVGVGVQAPSERGGEVPGELVEFIGALAQQAGVGVGADGVAAAGAAVVLAGCGCAGAWVAQGGVVLAGTDQQGVGVVVENDAVAGEVGAGFVDEDSRDDAAFEAGGLGGGGEGPAGGGAGDAFAGGELVAQAGGGVGGGQGGLDVEDGVDAAAAAGAVAEVRPRRSRASSTWCRAATASPVASWSPAESETRAR
ncbi:hypothetical protein GCM10010392_54230 [Streptomyces clavifer]|nr:hypothetical protein GCM10010392_54230 [Streptomyces clavifer]